MIKYFKELENRNNYYLPLINIDDNGKKEVYDSIVPSSFIEKNAELFSIGPSLINIFNNINIDECWNNSFENYEIKSEFISEYYRIQEDELPYAIHFFNNINIDCSSIINYLNIMNRLSIFFKDMFSHNKEIYESFSKKIKKAIKELEEYNTIEYQPKKEDLIYQPDSWYITPNNYLYNTGNSDHKGRDLLFNYHEICSSINNDEPINNPRFSSNCTSVSKAFLNISKNIEKNEYVTIIDFKTFLNYLSQPMCLEKIDNVIPITREKHIIQIIVGIVNAQAAMYNFFEDLCINTNNPKEELEKIEMLTNNNIRDILVRCCGFHKVESTVDKTITTSLINYEEAFIEYIDRGWTISFVPPIIIDEYDHTVKEYPADFLKIRKILKKIRC
ncbi:MAG: hypothetical protein J6O56_04830 [Bacilli bacterium]|nr:hypothetical protein [Bacilli bacterium]